jgi:septum site-determining protein MinD
LGIVPDDESIIVSTNRGVPAVMENNSRAGQAFRNIAGRLLGESIPFLEMDAPPSWLSRIGRLMRRS